MFNLNMLLYVYWVDNISVYMSVYVCNRMYIYIYIIIEVSVNYTFPHALILRTRSKPMTRSYLLCWQTNGIRTQTVNICRIGHHTADPLQHVTHHGALLADRGGHHRDRCGTTNDGISSGAACTGGPEPLINGKSHENICECPEHGWWFMVIRQYERCGVRFLLQNLVEQIIYIYIPFGKLM